MLAYFGLGGKNYFGLTPRTLKHLHAKLKQIRTVYPETTGWVIINKEGEYITENSNVLGKDEFHVVDVICSLLNIAAKFAQMLKEQDECSSIRIFGENQVFLLYSMSGLILGICVEMNCPTREIFGFAKEDEQMKSIINDVLDALNPAFNKTPTTPRFMARLSGSQS